MKAKQVLQIMNITRVTLCAYVKKGYIKATLLINKTYDYDEESIYKFLGKTKERVNVIYARVSTYKQKGDLERQVEKLQNYCNNNEIDVDNLYQEVASGINFERKEFSLLLQRIFNHEIDTIYISNRDRLTRLSFITMESIIKQFGTKIHILANSLDYKEELMEELLNITHLFSTKMYSNRKMKTKKVVKSI
jgi:predicted site-specific integrase-resolvase